MSLIPSKRCVSGGWAGGRSGVPRWCSPSSLPALVLAVQGLIPARVSKSGCLGFGASCRCASGLWRLPAGGGRRGGITTETLGVAAQISGEGSQRVGRRRPLLPALSHLPHDLRWKVLVSHGREGIISGSGCIGSPLAWWQGLISSAESS